ncbi:MAG TPA: isoleucine--tRNA ligase, partial [Candidatus Thermoplasmatota archaeon]|nr:isoleucine--tRNA ligase [Candidatus Thermoplasmatota archaeon]
EVKVEKELGFESKKDIEAYGIDKFVDACRHFATTHLKTMNEEFKELGIWMDWDHPYMTITNEYIEGAWWAIEKAHERGLLFESERVLTWCWRCETALANAEVEFEEREDPSAYVKFPVEGTHNEFLVIWTTTPWTLPANVAIAANPDIDYVKIRCRKDPVVDILIVAASQAEQIAKIGRYEHFDVVDRFKGSALEGLRYEHPFAPEVPYHRERKSDWNNRVILGAHVAGDRSGLVHTATGHGVEDFEAGKKYKIPVFSPVGEDGRYTEAAGSLAGLRVKGKETVSEADDKVLALLKERRLLLGSRHEKHSYAHCWRCKNPIVFRATSQWFIDVPKVKDKMISETKRVQWTPEWAGSARQLDWVEGAREWCITRQRYWGIPVPIWKCAHCRHVSVIGSRKELHHVSDYTGGDLHRPWIDKVRVVCPTRGCGGVMKRVPDVLDVWFDSAVASWASLHYPGHKAEFEKLFPVKWIVEGLDQTRGWFYSQLAAGVAAMDMVPYERVVMHGWVLMDGEKMSKSLGNAARPKDIISKFGADTLRLGLLSGAAPWEDVNFSVESLTASQRTLNILWNVHVFSTSYMSADAFIPEEGGASRHERALRAEDKWLLSRLQTTIAETSSHMEGYEFHRAVREIERFILEDLSRWYVRLVRERVWEEAGSDDKRAAYHTLHQALSTTARLLAPFAPYVAEALYQDLHEGRAHATVAMEDWPVADGALTDFDLERDMGTVRAVVEAAAYARQKANMKLRWPVAKLVVATDDIEVKAALTRFRPIVLEQANAKEVEFVGGEWEKLDIAAVPNKQFVGKTYRGEGPKVLAAIASLDQTQLRYLRGALREQGKATLDADGLRLELSREMLGFETRLPAHTSGADFPGGSVYVDTVVSKELEAEGAARDLTRRIQEMRKSLGLAMTDAIRVEVQAPDDFAALIAPHLAHVADSTRATHGLHFASSPEGDLVKDWDLEGTSIAIGVAKGAKSASAPAAPPAPPAPRPKATRPKAKPVAKAPPPPKPAAKKAPSVQKSAKRVVKAAKKAVKIAVKKAAKKVTAKKKPPAKKPKPKKGRR